jgi:hypothetical protein
MRFGSVLPGGNDKRVAAAVTAALRKTPRPRRALSLKTIIDRVELRRGGLRIILSLVPLTPAAAPPNRLQVLRLHREFPLPVKRRGVEMRFAIDALDPRATNPDPVPLN